MFPVPTGYTEAVQASLRNMSNISVTVAGQVYKVRTLTLRESVSENSDRLLPGCAACASIEATVVGAISASVAGSEMTATCGVVLPNGTTHNIPLGVFVIQKAQNKPGTNITTIIGYDRMCLLDGADFKHRSDDTTDLSKVWTTFKLLLHSIVPLDNSGTIKWASVPEIDDTYRVNRPLSELHAYNCKELLGYIAGAHGKFARFNRYGQLEFAWYAHSGVTVPPKAVYVDGLDLASSADVSDAIILYSNDDIESNGYGGYTNDLISSEFAAAYFAPLSKTTVSPGTLKYRGDPALQAGDIIAVTPRGGSTRQFAVSEHSLTFNGGMYGEIASHGLESNAFHSLNATEREIARLKKNYALVMPEAVTTE